MINKKTIKSYCKDDIKLIENYDKAINDKEHIWVCHHRLEFTILGEYALSTKDLIRLGMYYKRPYFELILMPQVEHIKLHQRTKNSFYGKTNTKESNKKRYEWSKLHINNAAMKYKEYKNNGGILGWNQWQKEYKNGNRTI